MDAEIIEIDGHHTNVDLDSTLLGLLRAGCHPRCHPLSPDTHAYFEAWCPCGDPSHDPMVVAAHLGREDCEIVALDRRHREHEVWRLVLVETQGRATPAS